jgi:hypothetical protein
MSEYVVLENQIHTYIEAEINQRAKDYELVSFTVVPVKLNASASTNRTYVAVMKRKHPEVTAI